MSFAILLLPADLNVPLPQYKTAIEQAVRVNGGRLVSRNVVQLADGGQFTFENEEFWPARLTNGVCRVIFDVALHTGTLVTNGGSGADMAPLKVKGSTVTSPPDLEPSVPVANPDALCAELQRRLTGWNRDMGRLRREGVIGVDDQPLAPPLDPGTEPRMWNDTSGIASACEANARKTVSRLGWKFVRSIVTRNEHWGVVWRADVAPRVTDRGSWFRDSCWRVRGTRGEGGLSMSSRPLMMFNKADNIRLLPKR